MGKLVAAFAVSHAPGQTGRPDAAPPEKKAKIFKAWDELKRKLETSRPICSWGYRMTISKTSSASNLLSVWGLEKPIFFQTSRLQNDYGSSPVQ